MDFSKIPNSKLSFFVVSMFGFRGSKKGGFRSPGRCVQSQVHPEDVTSTTPPPLSCGENGINGHGFVWGYTGWFLWGSLVGKKPEN